MPHEENRKIIKAGETSFAVILPKSWLRFYGLKNGDLVKVVSDGVVTIEPLAQKDKEAEKDG
jgi:bifunctional DNA-binding transcriptional regulator/antitoxin component of YhaV-PrlF toxin-antitoxin module